MRTTISSLPSPATAAPAAQSFHFVEYKIPAANAGPLSIVRGPDGAMWFTEAFAPDVGRIDLSGNITQFPVGQGQGFMAVGPDKDLWLTLGPPNVIGRLTTSGTLTQYTVPTPSFALEYITRGPDKRMWFENIAEDNGSVFVDAITVRGQISQYGPFLQACYFPFGMTSGADGNVWAVGGRCISKITPAGQISTSLLGRRFGLDFVLNGKDGDLWATDNLMPPPVALDQITYAGTIVHHHIPSATPNLYALIQVGDKIFFADQGGDRIGRIDESTFNVTEYPVPTPSADPSTLASDSNGNIWFTEFNSDKIGVLVLH